MKKIPTLHRFFLKVRVNNSTGCWEWQASKDKDGYGRFSLSGRNVRSHRFGYEIFYDPIPDGLEIDHLCKNRACVNPVHLETVTHLENERRKKHYNAIKTKCKRGHEFNKDNTGFNKDNTRYCKTCDRLRKRISRNGHKWTSKDMIET